MSREKLLKKQFVPGKLNVGINTGTTPRQVDGELLVARNVRPDQAGVLRKKFGYSALDGTFSGYRNLASYQGRPVLVGDNQLQIKQGSAATSGGFAKIDDCYLWTYNPTILNSGTDLAASAVDYAGQIVSLDMAEAGKVTALAIVTKLIGVSPDEYDYWIFTYERWTGQVLDSALIAGGDTSTVGPKMHKVVATGPGSVSGPSLAYVSLYGSGEPKGALINTTTGVIDAAGLSGLGAPVAPDYKGDIAYLGWVGLKKQIGFIYKTAVANIQFARMEISDIGAVTWSTTGLGAVSGTGAVYGIFPWALGHAGLVYYDQGGANRFIYAEVRNINGGVEESRLALKTWAAASGDVIESITGVRSTTDPARVWWTWVDSVNEYDDWVGYVTWTDDVTASGETAQALRCRLASKAWIDSSAVGHVCIHYRTYGNGALAGPQRSFMAMAEDETIKARFLMGMAQEPPVGFLPATIATADENNVPFWSTAHMRYEDATIRSASRIDLADNTVVDEPFNLIEVNNELMIPGALPQVCDGTQVFEHGFHWYPDGLDAVSQSVAGPPAGALTPSSVYAIIGVYEYFDSKGRRWLSTPSPVVRISIGAIANPGITINAIPTMTLGRITCNILIYRTAANGFLYYLDQRLTNVDAATATLAGFRATDLVQSDADLIKNEKIYTTGGAIDNVAMPPWRIGIERDNRLFFVPTDEKTERVRYTKAHDWTLGIEYNDRLVIAAGADNDEEITAVVQVGRYMVFFHPTSIAYSSGAPLSNALVGQGYTKVSELSNGIGAARAKTLVKIPGGLAFLSAQGFAFISSAMSLSTKLGEGPLFHTQNLGCNVVAGVAVPSEERLMYLCDDGDALCYHWRRGTWTHYGGDTSQYLSYDGVKAGSDVYFLTTAGRVMAEDPSTYLEDGDAADVSIRSKFNFGGINGWARIYRILPGGYRLSSCSIVASIYTEDMSRVSQQTFDATVGPSGPNPSDFYQNVGGAGGAEGGALELELWIPTVFGKASSLVLDLQVTGAAGQGVSFDDISFEVGLSGRGVQVGPDRKF